ncbi:MAG: hypothetical protein ACYTBJ_01940 [Planctomycetota bacterium]|jgi:hypothetical protein
MPILSSQSTNHTRHTIASAERWLYFANGYDVPHCWDGLLAAAPQSGKAAPSSTPALSGSVSGAVTTGLHGVQYRYLDKSTGYPSNASGSASVSTATAKSISVQVAASADARVDKIVIEMTLAGGATFFEASEVDNTAGWYNVSISDTALSEQTLDYDDTGHERPPVGRLQTYTRGRFFVGGPEEHAVGLAFGSAAASTVTFTGADIRDAMAGGYFHRTGQAEARLIDSVESTGDTGSIKVHDALASTFSSAAYSFYPDDPNRVYYSKALYPESIPTDNWFRVLQESGDTLKAQLPYRSAMLFFGERNLEILEWEVDPGDSDDGRLYPIPGGRGALCQEVVVEHDGIVYSMDREGPYRWAGGAPVSMAKPVQDVLNSVNFTLGHLFHAHYKPDTDELIIFVCYGDETYPQTALVYNARDDSWGTHYYDRAITASMVAPDGSAVLRPFMGTQDGASWYAGIGYSDGVYPGTTMKGTVGSGATTATIPITEGGLYATGQALAGVALFHDEGSQVGVILSNTASVMTLSPAFDSAPTVGDTVLLGRIKATHKTKVFRLGGPQDDQHNHRFVIDYTPLSTQYYLIVKVYEDGSATAKSDWGASTNEDGVTFQDSDAEILVDLTKADGHVEIPLGADWKKAVQFELIIEEPNIPFELIRYYVVADAEENVEE